VDFVEFASEPAVVYLAVVFASALLVVEFALPTLGLAGASSLLLVVVAVVGINEGDMEWWPLSLAAVSVGFWSVMVARRAAPVVQQGLAAVSFATGSLLFGILEEDGLTVVLAVLGSVALPAAFPVLFRHAQRLLDRQPDVGMDSYAGRTAPVVAWEGDHGTVMVDGSRWNAAGPTGLRVGQQVEITGYEGMCFTVRPLATTTEGMPMSVPTSPPEAT
jgi:membrane-bound ClpP family serine protease